MLKRTAEVKKITINSVTFSSIFNIGDTKISHPKTKEIAVQKEGATFTKEDNLYFRDYPIFNMEPNWLSKQHTASTTTAHHVNTINVQNVSIIGVSSSSIAQVGSIGKINADARIKHFRILLPENGPTQT
ncbi:spore germination protein GerPE [Virgibacillus byunsanensis]|uniref:Spore germination protein GerPE n=1 Tax=Virgibacillus byunsanensis TaxID=570945 RepID=A0ABW3LKU8_9BACI